MPNQVNGSRGAYQDPSARPQKSAKGQKATRNGSSNHSKSAGGEDAPRKRAISSNKDKLIANGATP